MNIQDIPIFISPLLLFFLFLSYFITFLYYINNGKGKENYVRQKVESTSKSWLTWIIMSANY
jgi:hypothetical protein